MIFTYSVLLPTVNAFSNNTESYSAIPATDPAEDDERLQELSKAIPVLSMSDKIKLARPLLVKYML
jgi:hypothetical protein